MLLRIQRGETIRSYIERSGFLSDRYVLGKHSAVGELTMPLIRGVATSQGWYGCEGFNRLLHNHTIQPSLSVFKSIQDMAYSGARYVSQRPEYWLGHDPRPKFCPECVRSDISSQGYSYWHRNASCGLSVCAIHNVLLEGNCPVCHKTFDLPDHGLDVMWKGCEGKLLQECKSRPSGVSHALKCAMVFEEICNYPFYIPLLPTLEILSSRIRLFVGKEWSCTTEQKLYGILSCKINEQLERVKRLSADNLGWYFESVDSDAIFNAIALLYNSLEQFLEENGGLKIDVRPITSLWSTFRAGGHESASYIEENYNSGLGEWYCPFPSPKSDERSSSDNLRKLIPVDFRCCPQEVPKEPGVERTPVDPNPPNPPIPCIG